LHRPPWVLIQQNPKKKETKQNNKTSSPVCLTQRYHQVYTSSGRFHKPSVYKIHFFFPSILSSFTSPTLHLSLFLCLALQQWQQTPTLHLSDPFEKKLNMHGVKKDLLKKRDGLTFERWRSVWEKKIKRAWREKRIFGLLVVQQNK